MKIRQLSKKWRFAIWILFWIPLSQLFPMHDHIAMGGVFSPVSAFIFPFIANPEHDTFVFDMTYIYFPALIFWSGAALFIYLTRWQSGANKK